MQKTDGKNSNYWKVKLRGMRCLLSFLLITLFFLIISCEKTNYQPDTSTFKSPKGTEVFKPDSATIAQNYKIPEWFKDAKFGIFIHWGVYAVPAYGSEWYARNMYRKNSDAYKSHVKRFGPVDQFGYKDFIPMFKAEKFNAEEWAKLFKKSGARYIVPVAEHHDGFSMYNSTFNPWNSVKMGPKIDVIGELQKAVKQEGLYFGLSSHRAENAWFFNKGMEIPSDVQDSTIMLYGERIPAASIGGITPETGENEGSNERSRQQWLTQTYELIDQYQPDLIWFDWTVGKYPFQPTFYKFLAYYYNNAMDWGKEVVVNTKVGYGDNIQVFDIERGKSDRIRRLPWQTDTSIGKKSWGYNPEEENKTPNHIIDDFVDIVSKNGNLLLNVGPKADGTITEEQQQVLLETGKWLKINGEAIYGTRPWVRSGEGETKGTSGYMTDGKATAYTASDIRFTLKKNILYAHFLEWTDDEVLIRSLAKNKGMELKIQSVEMLGSDESLVWEQTDKGLKVKFPVQKPCEYAHVLKIGLEGVAYGNVEIDENKNKLTVGTTIFNHSNKIVAINLKCLVDQQAQTEVVSLNPYKKMMISFNFQIAKSQYDIEFYADDLKLSN